MEAARKLSSFDDFESYQNYIENQKRTLEVAKRQQESVVRAKKHVSKNLSKTVLMACFVVGVIALILYRYSVIFEASYNNYELKKEIDQMTIGVSEMKSQLDSIVVLDNVEKVAIQELGMKYPSQEQIIYVNPPQSFKVHREKYALNKEDNKSGVIPTLYGKTEAFIRLFQ